MKFLSRYKVHYGINLKLAVPVVISQLGHVLVQTSDIIIIGHFAGTIALAAVSLGTSIFSVILLIGIGIAYGLTPLIAQNNARKDYAECGRLLSNSLFINLTLGIVLFILVAIGAVFFLGDMRQSPAVVAQAKPFLMLLALSVIPMLIFTTFKQFAEGLGFTKQAMAISIWGNILNICLGIIFVKGLFGITPMGIRGVGYSTLIDRCVMAVVMATYVLRSPKFKEHLKTFALRNINRLRSFQILRLGVPVALQYTFEIGAFSSAAVIIGAIGYVQLAAHQVAINMASMTYMMSSGIAAAATIKSGNYFGVKDHQNLRVSALSSYHIVLGFMFTTAIIFTICNHWLPWIYTSDNNVISIAAQLLIIAAVFQLFDGAQVVGLGVLRGMGDVNIPTLITFIAYWVIGLPIGYVLGVTFNLGVNGVWYGLTLGLMSSAILLFIRFQIISRRYKMVTI